MFFIIKLEKCIKESKKIDIELSILGNYFSESYYEYQVSKSSGNPGNIKSLCSFQSLYLNKYTFIEETNNQLLNNLNLIKDEILRIENIILSYKSKNP